ncbi:MAG: hypothetical protein ACM3O4_01870 [Ignavibacteriales bacterium]
MKKKILLLILALCCLLPSNIKAGDNIGGGGEYNGNDCGSTSSVCYSSKLSGKTVNGIRITIVDKYGAKVAGTNSADYINNTDHINALKNKSYYTYYAIKRHKNVRLTTKDDILYKNVTDVLKGEFPDFIDKGTNNIIKEYFTSITQFESNSDDPGIRTFYDACGYKWQTMIANGQIKNHYLLIEPLTYIRVTDKINQRTVHYFGTVTDIAKMMTTHGYVLWSGFFGTMLPLSIYVRDNEETGAKSTAGLTSIQTWVDNNQLTDYSREILTSNGTAAGHIWLPKLPTKTPACNYNDPTNFPKSQTDSDRKCCPYVESHLSEYGITLAQLHAKYPACKQDKPIPPDPCTFDLNIKISNNCANSTEGYIKDIDNWVCIFNSRSSSNNDIKNHFYTWENRYCSYFCREELSYQFPTNSVEVLAGNRFTLGGNGYFPNASPIHFIGRSECRTTSPTGSIRWDLFETDWEAANDEVVRTWDLYQIEVKKDVGISTYTQSSSRDCANYCDNNVHGLECCVSADRDCDDCYYGSPNTCVGGIVNGKYDSCASTKNTCSYGCSPWYCTSSDTPYDHGYTRTPSTQYYTTVNGSALTINTSSWCTSCGNSFRSTKCSPDSTNTSSTRNAYNNAVQTRTDYEAAITKCNDWERSYDEFNPNLKFKYEEAIYGGKVYTLINTLEKRTQTNYFINNVTNSSINTYKRTGTKYKYVCSTTGLTCKKGSSIGGSTYVYPKNDWLKQFTTKEYEYGLPGGVYNYISKPSGESYDYNPGGNYYNLGYSSLPVHYSRQAGYYDFELDYDSFGTNHKFNKFIFGNAQINIDYSGNTELKNFLIQNNLMQYISLCASGSANCSSLNYNFYSALVSGGQLSNFINSDCAQQSYCKVNGSYITCGVPHTYTYRGTIPANTPMYISGNWYWYYGIPMEVWNYGYTWWVRNGGAWDYLSRENSHDRYYPNGDYYDKYICYSIQYGGQCTYQGNFYAPAGTLLDGKESPSNFVGENVYSKLQKCLMGNNNGSTPTEAFNGRTKYECQYRVVNQIVCPVGQTCDYVGLSVVYRPIQLDDPFPGLSGSGRTPGSNWNNSSTISEYIINNRDVSANRVYYDRDPLYKITLTPSIIKSIREYNKKQSQLYNGYSDFQMNCLSNGTRCLSGFIREGSFTNLFSGCGISGKQINPSRCAANEAW